MSAQRQDRPRLTRAVVGVEASSARPVRMVHLGLGAFHRSHQAWYTDQADRRTADGEGWGIASFTGRSPAAARPLQEQDGLYTLLTRGPDGDSAEVVASITAAHDGADTGSWCRYLEDPAVAVLTLTVTEAGYRRTGQAGLDTDDRQVLADLAALRTDARARVTSAPARVVQGLLARHRGGGEPLAVVSCDNLADNGAVTRRVVLDACSEVDAAVTAWAGTSVSFVSTMVDRITPATTAEDRATASQMTGFEDAAPVVAEPFSEWVLAGGFPAGRPDWAAAGAAVVDDVTPFEQRKLWLLNGGHSLLAYAGSVRGHHTIAEAVADPTCRSWLEQLWDDAQEHLPFPADEVDRYREALLARFSNSRIQHRLAQIATDGSQKLPLRVLPVVRQHRHRGDVPTGEVVAVAAWVANLRGHGAPVSDPRAGDLAGLAAGAPPEAVRRVLADLDPSLADDGQLRSAVVDQLVSLERGAA